MLLKCDSSTEKCTPYVHSSHFFIRRTHLCNQHLGPETEPPPTPGTPSCPPQSPCPQEWPLPWFLLACMCFCAFVFFLSTHVLRAALSHLLFSLTNYESESPCWPVTPGLCLPMVVQDSRHPCSEFPLSLLLAPHTDTALHILCAYIARNPCEESPRRELHGWTASLDFIYFPLGTRFLTSSRVVNIRL